MKIAFTSDIHGDHCRENGQILPYLAQAVRDASPDVFIIVGDAASGAESVAEVLWSFRHLEIQKCYVPGNHDVWVRSKRAVKRGEDSGSLYRTRLAEHCAENGFHYLPANPLVLGRVGFVGSAGWYDYSLADPRLSDTFKDTDYHRGEFTDPRFEQGGWNDIRFAKWMRYPDASDWRQRRMLLRPPEVCDLLFDQFCRDVDSISSSVDSLVAAVHTAGFPESRQQDSLPDPFNAYEGCTRYGEYLAPLAKEKDVYYLCGHRHRPLDATIASVRVLRSPVGYLRDFEGDFAELAKQCVRCFTLP